MEEKKGRHISGDFCINPYPGNPILETCTFDLHIVILEFVKLDLPNDGINGAISTTGTHRLLENPSTTPPYRMS